MGCGAVRARACARRGRPVRRQRALFCLCDSEQTPGREVAGRPAERITGSRSSGPFQLTDCELSRQVRAKAIGGQAGGAQGGAPSARASGDSDWLATASVRAEASLARVVLWRWGGGRG